MVMWCILGLMFNVLTCSRSPASITTCFSSAFWVLGWVHSPLTIHSSHGKFPRVVKVTRLAVLARFPTEEYLRVVNPIKVFYFLIVIYYYPLLKRIGYLRLSIRLMPASRLQADRFFIPCSIPVRQLADSLFSLCLHGLQKFQGCDPIVIFYFLIVIWPPAPKGSYSSRFN